MVILKENFAVATLLGLKRSPQSKIPDEVLQDLIDRLVKADRLLAVVSIQDAADNGVPPKRISLARAWQQQGDEWAGWGFPTLAILNYQIAWLLAQPFQVDHPRKCSDGTVAIEFPGIPGEVYVVEASTNLVNWVEIGTASADESGTVTFSDAEAHKHAARFYRVRER